MSNQQKFIDEFNRFRNEFDPCELISGDPSSGESEFIGSFELKDTQSDYDDGNQYLAAVYYFHDLDVYVKFEGYYASYGGTDFSKYSFVTPKEKIVTIYE